MHIADWLLEICPSKRSDCCLMPNDQFVSYIVEITSYIRRDDNAVLFVLGHHAYLDVYSANPLKQQSVCRNNTGTQYPDPSQPLIVLSL